MKKIIYIIIIAFVSVGFGCSKRSGQNISIQTTDNAHDFEFSASFPDWKTGKMQSYMEKELKENRIFNSSDDHKKAEITLKDGTHFYLKYEPGYIQINFDKDNNSIEAYNRLKNVCKGFSEELKDWKVVINQG